MVPLLSATCSPDPGRGIVERPEASFRPIRPKSVLTPVLPSWPSTDAMTTKAQGVRGSSLLEEQLFALVQRHTPSRRRVQSGLIHPIWLKTAADIRLCVSNRALR